MESKKVESEASDELRGLLAQHTAKAVAKRIAQSRAGGEAWFVDWIADRIEDHDKAIFGFCFMECPGCSCIWLVTENPPPRCACCQRSLDAVGHMQTINGIVDETVGVRGAPHAVESVRRLAGRYIDEKAWHDGLEKMLKESGISWIRTDGGMLITGKILFLREALPPSDSTFAQHMNTLFFMANDIESRHGPKNSEVMALRAAMEAMKHEQGYVQQHATDEKALRQTRYELRLHRQKAEGEYWTWQGDGEDHIESLTCPVLVPADVVRNWVAVQSRAEQFTYELTHGYMSGWSKDTDAALARDRLLEVMKPKDHGRGPGGA